MTLPDLQGAEAWVLRDVRNYLRDRCYLHPGRRLRPTRPRFRSPGRWWCGTPHPPGALRKSPDSSGSGSFQENSLLFLLPSRAGRLPPGRQDRHCGGDGGLAGPYPTRWRGPRDPVAVPVAGESRQRAIRPVPSPSAPWLFLDLDPDLHDKHFSSYPRSHSSGSLPRRAPPAGRAAPVGDLARA